MRKLATVFLASTVALTVLPTLPSAEVLQNTSLQVDEDTINEESFKEVIKERQKELKKIIKQAKKEELDSLLDAESKKLDSKKYDKYLHWYYMNHNESLFGVKGTEENPIDLNDYLEKGLKEGRFEEVNVDEVTSVIFTDGPLYFISERSIVEESKVPALTLNSSNIGTSPNNSFTLAASDYTTQYVYNKVVGRNAIGADVYTVYVGGYFDYNYTTVTPRITVSYADLGTATGWDVISEEDGTWVSSDKRKAEMWQEATFQWTFSGINMDTEYVKVRITCDSGGNEIPYIHD